MSKSYKSVRLRGMESNTLSAVYQADLGWRKTKCKVKVPPLTEITSYDLVFGDTTLLVLDPYGNELSAEMDAIIFGGIPHKNEEGWTLAIDRKTGKIHRLAYAQEGKKFVAVYWEYETGTEEVARVPASHLPRLDELRSAKRPFSISFTEQAAISFAEREYGYRDLRMNTVIRLSFWGADIEIWGNFYREVGSWTRAQEDARYL